MVKDVILALLSYVSSGHEKRSVPELRNKLILTKEKKGDDLTFNTLRFLQAKGP